MKKILVCSVIAGLLFIVGCDQTRGKAIAQQHCGECHGVDGISKRPDVPNLCGQKKKYIKDKIREYQEGTRYNETMSHQSDMIEDEKQIEEVAAYYSSISCK